MKRLFTQLGRLLGKDSPSAQDLPRSRSSARIVQIPPSRHRSNLLSQAPQAENDPVDVDDAEPQAAFVSSVEEIGPGKTVLRSSYLLDPRNVDPSLTLADTPVSGDADSDFDPYNSGQFDRSRNWSRHPRK